jgi:hypothetical protein
MKKYFYLVSTEMLRVKPRYSAMTVCEQKFRIMQYFDISSPLDIPAQIAANKYWRCIGF